MKSRLHKILKSKSGASFMFVLGLMLMLMAIGVSAMAAASANVGFLVSQRAFNQARILDDSIHNNILHSLQDNGISDTSSLRQLAQEVYEANDDYYAAKYNANGLANTGLAIDLGGAHDLSGGNVKLESVTLSFPRQTVNIYDAVPMIEEIPEVTAVDEITGLETIVLVPAVPAVPREPKTATLDFTMTVVVILDVNGKKTASRAVYEYTGGQLSDDPDDSYSLVPGEYENPMEFTAHGVWRLIRHEKIDTVS